MLRSPELSPQHVVSDRTKLPCRCCVVEIKFAIVAELESPLSTRRHMAVVCRSRGISIMRDVREPRFSLFHSPSNCGPVRRRGTSRSTGGRSVFLHCRAAAGEKRYSRAREEREHGGRRTELSTGMLRRDGERRKGERERRV